MSRVGQPRKRKHHNYRVDMGAQISVGVSQVVAATVYIILNGMLGMQERFIRWKFKWLA